MFSSIRARRIVLAIASAIIALVLLSTALFAQTTPTAADLDSAMAAQGQTMGHASTGCIAGVDTAVTIFRGNLDSLERAQLEVHERVHRKQIADTMAADSTLDCFTAFWSLTASPMANLLAEVPAYRAQAQWLSENTSGFDPERFFEYWARDLYFAYSKRLDYDYILGFLQSGVAPKVKNVPPSLMPSIN